MPAVSVALGRAPGGWLTFPASGAVRVTDIVFAMPTKPLPAAFALLDSERNLGVEAALLEALDDLDAPAQAAAVLLLTQRAHTPSLAALVGRFHDAGETLRRLIRACAGLLQGGVRAAMASPSFERRASAIELIVESRDGRSLYLLANALRSTCVRTRELAGNGLHRLAGYLLDHREAEPSDDEDGRVLDTLAGGLTEALHSAIHCWELHFQPGVLDAVLWMGERLEGAVLEKLQEPRTRFGRALSDRLEGTSDPRIAGFALFALTIPELRKSAVSAISSAHDPAFIRAVIERSWLLGDPEIERACRWIRAIRPGSRWIDEIRSFGADSAARAVRFLASTGGAPDGKLELFRELFDTGGLELQSAVVWHLIRDESAGATGLLNLLAGRCRGDLARITARELTRRRLAGAGAVGAVERGLAEQMTAPTATDAAFREYWAQFDQLDPEEVAALAEAMRPIAGELAGDIGKKLGSADAHDRARALQILDALGLVERLDESVYHLSRDPEPIVRSAAVRLLARLPGAPAARILRDAVNDPDGRVQANAIEALEELDFLERFPDLKEKLDSPHNRVRANAVKALLRKEFREAGEALLDMLEDSSSKHRLSGLWVVQELRLRALADRVVTLSREDPDERVRRSAQAICRDLGALCRRGGGRSPTAAELGVERPMQPIGGVE